MTRAPIIVLSANGRIPSKKNSRQTTASGRSFPSAAYGAWHSATYPIIEKQMADMGLHGPIEKCGTITISITFPDKRKADLTNKAESIMDLLVDAGVLADDSWRVTGPVTLIPKYNKDEYGFLVTITL